MHDENKPSKTNVVYMRYIQAYEKLGTYTIVQYGVVQNGTV